jgi:hypothetical protein
MKTDEDRFWEVERTVDYVVDRVASRGWTDNPVNADRFDQLRTDLAIRSAQVAALYEEYFLPERHEFEWQVLSHIIDTIVGDPTTQFIGGVVVTGIIGSLAYDILKKMCQHTAQVFEQKLGERGKERAIGFRQIASDAQTIQNYFSATERARINDIEKATGIPREKIYPLLKIAGFQHNRRMDACYWQLPSSLSKRKL